MQIQKIIQLDKYSKNKKQKTIRIKKQNEKINERDHVRCYTFTEENNNASCPEKVLKCLRKILCYLELRKIQKKSFYLNVQNLLYLLAGNGFKYSAHTDVLRIV